MSKTTAVVAQQQNLPYANPYLEAAAEGGNEIGRLLKFVKGEWIIGDDAVADGTEYIAHIDQLVRGWVKFEDEKVVERDIGKVANGFKLKKRDELSDADPATWCEKDEETGQPRDPWSEQWYLPLVGVKHGDVVTFVTGSKGGIGAVADLCRVYGHQQRDNLRPIIALKTRSYKHKKYGRIVTPDFPVIGWDDGGAKESTTVPVQPMHTKGIGKAAAIEEIPPVESEEEFR